MNWLIRRFFPKGTNFDEVTREAMSLSWWFKEEPAELPGFSRSDLG